MGRTMFSLQLSVCTRNANVLKRIASDSRKADRDGVLNV